jgi:hypothetical protein
MALRDSKFHLNGASTSTPVADKQRELAMNTHFGFWGKI